MVSVGKAELPLPDCYNRYKADILGSRIEDTETTSSQNFLILRLSRSQSRTPDTLRACNKNVHLRVIEKKKGLELPGENISSYKGPLKLDHISLINPAKYF